MFDIGWSELLVIGVVLIVVVGPKDLPKMLRTFGRSMSQMRKMAGDFRKQFDEALREAELDEVRQTVSDMKSLDPTKDIRKAMNPMKAVGDEIRSSLTAATKAPVPTIPSASAPAQPVEPPLAGSVVGQQPIQPMKMMSHPPGPAHAAATPAESSVPVPAVSASPPTPVGLNGTAVHANGLDAGEAKREQS
ncbi:MAG: twin-arginine translocase subunit TatB [Rhizobiaceae bacterium]|nr:twin-arginine translocase subunit TatB [Rhizobiaceae bacterium]